jgi:hypothetical protein
MLSSGILSRVALVRTDISEDHIASIIRVTIGGGLGTTLAVIINCDIVFLSSVFRLLVNVNVFPVSPILVALITEALLSSKTSVLTRTIRHNIPQDGILHSHIRGNLKSYTINLCSPLNIRDQISHSYRPICKSIVFYILILKVLDSRREDKNLSGDW